METSQIRESVNDILMFVQRNHVVSSSGGNPDRDVCLTNDSIENPEEGNNKETFHGFDWFPPTVMYSLLDGDLSKTKTFIVWIKSVRYILLYY